MKKKNYFSLITVILLTSLSSCDMGAFSEEIADEIITGLIPNFWAFLIQLLSLIVMIVAVIYLGYKPLKKYLDKRSDAMHDEVEEAFKNNEISKKNLLDSEKNIVQAKKDAADIIDAAKETAKKERSNILKEAENEANKIRKKADLDIKRKEEEAQEAIRSHIINVALDASKNVLQREINEKDDQKIIDDFIKEMDKE